MVSGWHRGERAIQKKLAFDGPMSTAYTWIEGEMPEEHRIFHATRLPFIPVTTLDADGRPWACIFAGQSGKPGFVSSPNWDRLDMEVRVWDGDPFKENVNQFGEEDKMLAAGIGIEFSTRRRNKFAGYISEIRKRDDVYRLKLTVNQAIGNCPKYINIRDLLPHPDTKPEVIYRVPHIPSGERLPDEVVAFIHNADTVFIGSSYVAGEDEKSKFPSHVGSNQRGGKPGFIRVRPSDGKTVVLPDYSGNRLLTSLGNIEATPLASLTFVDFVTGDILYLTGDARNVVGEESKKIMPRQNVITLVTVTGYTFVRDALPVRQEPDTEPERSPYSPPVHLLAEEKPGGASAFMDDQPAVTLSKIVLHSADLATFEWEVSKPVHIIPGQTAILDFTELVGSQAYSHMAPWKPNSINDDRIRTWTVSSAHLNSKGTTSFSMTMREKPGGTVTGALFAIARKLSEMRPELLPDTRPLGVQVRLVGIAGEFKLPISLAAPDADAAISPIPNGEPNTRSMLWVAGGIGLTPFLSMFSAIARSPVAAESQWDIALALSTREPEVLVSLIAAALDRQKSPTPSPKLRLKLDIYTSKLAPEDKLQSLGEAEGFEVSVKQHKGRIPAEYFAGVENLPERSAFLCGPEDFERGVLDMLKQAGYEHSVVRESFEY